MLISFTVEYDTDSKLLTIDGRGATRLPLNQAAEEVASELKRRKRKHDIDQAIDGALKECGI